VTAIATTVEAQAQRRFVILPDRGNSIGSGVFGAALLGVVWWFGLGWIGYFLTALGAVCICSAILSNRGLSSLPRIEIDNRGIREVSHFGTTISHPWAVIASFEPDIREHAEGTDYVLRIKVSRSLDEEVEHSDINLDCYLPKSIDRGYAVTWMADWLDQLRLQALSGADALGRLKQPKYLRGVFA
jgi:hypothetical protein